MPSYTKNFNFIKPSGPEEVNIGQINQNMDSIDTIIFDNEDYLDATYDWQPNFELNPGNTPILRLHKRSGMVQLSFEYLYTGPTVVANAQANIADQIILTFTNSDFWPKHLSPMMTGPSGYALFWGHISTTGNVAVTAGTFPNQAFPGGVGNGVGFVNTIYNVNT